MIGVGCGNGVGGCFWHERGRMGVVLFLALRLGAEGDRLAAMLLRW